MRSARCKGTVESSSPTQVSVPGVITSLCRFLHCTATVLCVRMSDFRRGRFGGPSGLPPRQGPCPPRPAAAASANGSAEPARPRSQGGRRGLDRRGCRARLGHSQPCFSEVSFPSATLCRLSVAMQICMQCTLDGFRDVKLHLGARGSEKFSSQMRRARAYSAKSASSGCPRVPASTKTL